MSASARIPLIASFLILLAALLANGYLSSANLNVLERNRQRVAHTRQITDAIEALFATIQDAETGQRGYLITGQREYLAPYNRAMQNLRLRLVMLQTVARGDQQEANVARLGRLVQGKLEEMAETIRAMQTSGAAAAGQLVGTNRGMDLMDQIRRLVTSMEFTEQARLIVRERESEVSQRSARLSFIGQTAASIALLCIVAAALGRGIAERERAEQNLKRREDWLSTTLRSIGDAVIATDESGNVALMNRVAEQLTGWHQDAARGKPLREVFSARSETDPGRAIDPAAVMASRGSAAPPIDWTVLFSRNGAQRPIEWVASPIAGRAGGAAGAVIVFRDITGRRMEEKERERRTQEVAQLNERLRRTVTETHHRVKNNLQLITALIDMERRNSDGTVPASELARLGQNIQALGAVHEVLTLASREGADVAVVPVRSVIDRLLPTMRTALRDRLLTAEVEDIELPGKKSTAVALLANELVANATKHGQGEVRLSVRREDGIVTLEVADEGPGFPEGFDPETAANTGLNLVESISRYDLRGEICYETPPAGGARVSVTFPP